MKIGGHTFTGPYSPYKSFTSIISGVYAILDTATNVVVDVGQTVDLNNRFPNHDRQDQWHAYTPNHLGLYILPVAKEQHRLLIESAIRYTYRPPCGVR